MKKNVGNTDKLIRLIFCIVGGSALFYQCD